MSASEVFRRITSALDQAGIGYMLSGSFASAVYGAPRSTQDIDLVIQANLEQLQEFIQNLHPDEFYFDFEAAMEAHRQQSMFNIIDRQMGWKIDLIICKKRPFSEEEFRRRRRIEVQGVPLFAASAEDVVIAKLEWSKLGQSQRQIEDVSAILRARWDLLDHSYIDKWIRELNLGDEWIAARLAAGKQ